MYIRTYIHTCTYACIHTYIHLGTLEKATQWMMLVCLVRQITYDITQSSGHWRPWKGQVVTHRQYPGIKVWKGNKVIWKLDKKQSWRHNFNISEVAWYETVQDRYSWWQLCSVFVNYVESRLFNTTWYHGQDTTVLFIQISSSWVRGHQTRMPWDPTVLSSTVNLRIFSYQNDKGAGQKWYILLPTVQPYQ